MWFQYFANIIFLLDIFDTFHHSTCNYITFMISQFFAGLIKSRIKHCLQVLWCTLISNNIEYLWIIWEHHIIACSSILQFRKEKIRCDKCFDLLFQWNDLLTKSFKVFHMSIFYFLRILTLTKTWAACSLIREWILSITMFRFISSL